MYAADNLQQIATKTSFNGGLLAKLAPSRARCQGPLLRSHAVLHIHTIYMWDLSYSMLHKVLCRNCDRNRLSRARVAVSAAETVQQLTQSNMAAQVWFS
jgi:hypothetical protein